MNIFLIGMKQKPYSRLYFHKIGYFNTIYDSLKKFNNIFFPIQHNELYKVDPLTEDN